MTSLSKSEHGRTTATAAAGLLVLVAGGCVQWPDLPGRQAKTGRVNDARDPAGGTRPIVVARPARQAPIAGQPGTRAGTPTPRGAATTDGDVMALSTFGALANPPRRPLVEAGEPGARAFSPTPARPDAPMGASQAAGTESGVTQVTFATEGADFDPDASSDGRFIVFASTQHQASPDIYIKTVESRVVTQLTSDPAQDVMPTFNPDGSMVAFASNRSGNWDVYAMPAGGGSAVRVTDTTAHELHPSWSPDGTQLVYCRLGDVSGQWEVWITDALNSGVAHFVGYGMFPEWCPKRGTGEGGADKILFQRGRQRGDRAFGVWTIDFKDGHASNPTEIASSPGAACINPAWSPDGRWIVFSSVPAGPTDAPSGLARARAADLWMADLNGSARIRLTGGPALALMPAWGPNGRIYYSSNRSGLDNIWALSAHEAVRLASNEAARRGIANAPETRQAEPDR